MVASSGSSSAFASRTSACAFFRVTRALCASHAAVDVAPDAVPDLGAVSAAASTRSRSSATSDSSRVSFSRVSASSPRAKAHAGATRNASRRANAAPANPSIGCTSTCGGSWYVVMPRT